MAYDYLRVVAIVAIVAINVGIWAKIACNSGISVEIAEISWIWLK